MARNWKKFKWDELLYLWNGHKDRNGNIDPLRIHYRELPKKIELTHEDIENLVDDLLERIFLAKRDLTNEE